MLLAVEVVQSTISQSESASHSEQNIPILETEQNPAEMEVHRAFKAGLRNALVKLHFVRAPFHERMRESEVLSH